MTFVRRRRGQRRGRAGRSPTWPTRWSRPPSEADEPIAGGEAVYIQRATSKRETDVEMLGGVAAGGPMRLPPVWALGSVERAERTADESARLPRPCAG
eukprot:1190035-Prorocentrum_minimum.AAC.2